MKHLALALLVVVLGCKNPEAREAEDRQKAAASRLAQAQADLAQGRYELAISALKGAISATPNDLSLYITLADAYRQSGNETGAVLTLKQAEAVPGADAASLKRLRADLYLHQHQYAAAIGELSALRDQDLLTDTELLDLARLLARQGKVDEAFRTLEKLKSRDPDNVEAKVMNAEILLLRGDEVLAGKLMDQLLTEQPGLVSARMLRARYFMTNQQLDDAEKDLAMVSGADAKRPDFITLKARLLGRLHRYDEAAGLLAPVIDENPRDVQALAMLAETRLEQGKKEEAQTLVNKALAIQPRFPRGLYTRGRIHEAMGQPAEATAAFEAAVKADPSFAPALGKLWSVYAKRGDQVEALAALEKLFFLNEISADEKVALAGMYADTGLNLERGQQLIGEALKREPANADYRAIRAKLARAAGSGSGVQVLKRGR